VRAEDLPRHLARGPLAPLYVVSGDELLLAIEAQDAIRAAARAAGYTERSVLHADARYDWSQLTGATQGMSLFSERRIVEIRLPSGKPGREGGEALTAHAQSPAPDVLTLLALPALDYKARKAAWVAAVEAAAVWVEVSKIERQALPDWIGQRLARQQQRARRAALDFIADRVEGNLLAAHQEIGKLGLLYPAGELTLEQVSEAVLDVARFDLWTLPQAMLAGDRVRVLRTLQALRAEGEALPLVLWAITEEVRTLLRLRGLLDRGLPWAQAAREVWVRREKEALTQRAVQRADPSQLGRLLARCAEVDRLFKGLRPRGTDSDPWLELADIACAVGAGRYTAPGAPPYASRSAVPS
jgi:DNA polymerase-3 subunit delta